MKFLFPPLWLLMLLTVFTAVGVPFALQDASYPVSIAIYAVAFYTVCALTAFCICRLPGLLRTGKQRLHEHPLADRYLTDKTFRGKVSLYASLGINLQYIGLHLLSWHQNRSWWFVILAVYYAILSGMRFLLVHYLGRHQPGSDPAAEWRRSRVCAGILLLLNLFLSAAVLMILYQNKGFAYPGVLIYVMAAYTFYSTIHAITDLVRYRKLGSPVLSTAKTVSLSAALVSLLNLETAMFSQFGAEMSRQDQQLFIILTGAGVSVVVVTLSVLLMIRSTKEIRSVTHGK